jgi:hypothetical protein
MAWPPAPRDRHVVVTGTGRGADPRGPRLGAGHLGRPRHRPRAANARPADPRPEPGEGAGASFRGRPVPRLGRPSCGMGRRAVAPHAQTPRPASARRSPVRPRFECWFKRRRVPHRPEGASHPAPGPAYNGIRRVRHLRHTGTAKAAAVVGAAITVAAATAAFALAHPHSHQRVGRAAMSGSPTHSPSTRADGTRTTPESQPSTPHPVGARRGRAAMAARVTAPPKVRHDQRTSAHLAMALPRLWAVLAAPVLMLGGTLLLRRAPGRPPRRG